MVNNVGTSRCSKAFFLKVLTLSLLWGFGLLVGISFTSCFRGSFASLVCSAILQPVSIVFLLVNVLFLYIFVTCKRGVLLFACFIKAICFGFTWMSLGCLFSSSGWLVRGLLLFSDTAMCLFLLSRTLYIVQCTARRSVPYSAIVCVAAIVFDYLVLSPFASGLF